MVLPAGTAHSATVGPAGCACIEGKARPRMHSDGEIDGARV
jgi:hypothetical protein